MARTTRRGFLAGCGALGVRSILRGEAVAVPKAKFLGRAPSEPFAQCPLRVSNTYKGLNFSGRHQEYQNADTWYPSWASGGVQYSPFADGTVLDAKGNKVGHKHTSHTI